MFEIEEPDGNYEPEERLFPPPSIPQKVFYQFEKRFGTIVLTVPNLSVDLPENPLIKPRSDKFEDVNVIVKNNGRYKLSNYRSDELDGNNWDNHTEIEMVILTWMNLSLTGEELLGRRAELIQRFIEDRFEGPQNLAALSAIIGADYLKGQYLYRALNKKEWTDLSSLGYLWYSPIDPSANFESEEMFERDDSQVKAYAEEKEGHSGHIIRWKSEHPLFYRVAGFQVPRVSPTFAHYLPKGIELSEDLGKSFRHFEHPITS